MPGSFALASLLTLLAIVTLAIKTKLEGKIHSDARIIEPSSAGASA
jgi:ABC-type sulfate transport system permease subunit